MQVHSHGTFSVSVNFVFVSPDGSFFRSRSVQQGRTAFIYPCGTGCDGQRLPEADSKEKGTQEKMTASIPGLTAP